MSTNSPVRASFTAQRRASRDSRINRFPNLSQKSPDIDSPNLNEEQSDRFHK
jgi:hypothetical protein